MLCGRLMLLSLRRRNYWCLVRCCNSAPLLQPVQRKHPGRRVVLAVASEQLRHGHCPRLAPQNPYALSTLINSWRLHFVPEAHSLWMCVSVCVCVPWSSSLDPPQKAAFRYRFCWRFSVGAYISLKEVLLLPLKTENELILFRNSILNTGQA